jgi:hypothetical protein
MTPREYFENNSYVLLHDVLSKDLCENLTKRMFQLCEDGKMVKDDQCPKSEAIYGDPVFDGLLEKLAEPIGQHIGKELTPTYTYARIYRTGEVLSRHTDRPSCEISGTLTLGFDGMNVWPIYLAADPNDERGKRVDLKIGDFLLYRGEDLVHWRPEFKGEWQCQVFFHFVDANGPHKDNKFDGRPELGLGADTKAENQNQTVGQQSPDTGNVKQSRQGVFPIYNGVMIPSWDLQIPGLASITSTTHPNLAFTPEECERIIGFASSMYAEEGSIGAGADGLIKKDIRNVDLYQIPMNADTRWAFDKLARIVSIVNAEHFDYEIMGITHELQLLHYDSGEDPGHYEWHVDVGNMTSSTRKISVSVQLTAPDQYTGGDLMVNSNGEMLNASRDRGALALFPSYCLHKVTPMQEGERWALVIWVHGSKRFR